jgi:hypothetical protein
VAALELREALYYRLSNYANLTSLISTRIYPKMAPQSAALPYVTYEVIGDASHHAHGSDADTYTKIVQLHSWADDYDEVDGVSKQARLALQDYMGNMAGAGDTFTVQRIFFDGRVDLEDIDPETMLISYHTVQTFIIWHT